MYLSNPLVSCIILSYEKDYKFLFGAIESLLAQNYPNIELIISDDGTSFFNHLELEIFIKLKKNNNISNTIIYSNESNLGTVKNFNKAIKSSKGQYIIVLACDDLFFDSFVINNIVNFFLKEKCLIATAFRDIYDNKLEEFIRREPFEEYLKYFYLPTKELFKKLCSGNFISGACTYYDRKLFELYGYFDEDFKFIEDYPKYLSLTRQGCKIHLMNFVSIKYRSGGVSSLTNLNRISNDLDLIKIKEIEPYYIVDKKLDFDYISIEFLNALRFYEKNYTIKLKRELTNFLKAFIELFIRADFVIPEAHIIKYLENNKLIADLFYLSELKNTDYFLEKLLKFDIKKGNVTNIFIKILTIYSLNNTIRIKYDFLFSLNKKLASFWYIKQFSFFKSLVNPIFYANIHNHIEKLAFLSEEAFSYLLVYPYFLVNFIEANKEESLKTKINNIIKKKLAFKNLNIKVDKNKIAIASANFFKNSTVFRANYKIIQLLAKDYELVLLNLGSTYYDNEDNLFKKVINIKLESNFFDLSSLENNDFALIYYLDIDSSIEALLLSNLRLAPLQITNYNNTLNTYNSEIDYLLVSKDIANLSPLEKKTLKKTIFLKGLDLDFSLANFNYKKTYHYVESNIISIVCPWNSFKINYQTLLLLKEVLAKSNKKVIFKFLPELNSHTEYLTLKADIEAILGEENVVVFPSKTYIEYLKILEEADLILDSLPYGEKTIVMEILALKKIIITLTEEGFYNNFASIILKKLNLNELIAINKEDFINKIVNLVVNNSYREILRNKINNIDLDEIILTNSNTLDLKNSIDILISNLN